MQSIFLKKPSKILTRFAKKPVKTMSSASSTVRTITMWLFCHWQTLTHGKKRIIYYRTLSMRKDCYAP